MRYTYVPTVVLLLVLLLAPAEAKRVKLAVGDSAPKWKELQGIDGKDYASSSVKEAKAIAVIFTSIHCPVAQAYTERLAKIHQDFHKKGLVLLAINSNKDDDVKSLKRYVAKHGLKYTVAIDKNQKIAKSFGALLTPEVFLLNAERKIAYHGAIDDDGARLTGKPKKHYLREAIEAVLAGRAPNKKQTRATGCAIRWK